MIKCKSCYITEYTTVYYFITVFLFFKSALVSMRYNFLKISPQAFEW